MIFTAFSFIGQQLLAETRAPALNMYVYGNREKLSFDAVPSHSIMRAHSEQATLQVHTNNLPRKIATTTAEKAIRENMFTRFMARAARVLCPRQTLCEQFGGEVKVCSCSITALFSLLSLL